MKDPRSSEYVQKHGRVSYEVDALKPEVLNQILEDAILELIDVDRFNDSLERQRIEKEAMKKAIDSIDV